MCSARRNFFWLLITLSLSFSLSLQYFRVNHRKGREIDWVLDSKREREKVRGWRRCIVEMWASLSQVFSVGLWSAWVCSPRTRVVTDRGKQDYTTLSCPINYPPVWGNKLSLSPRPVPSLWTSSPFLLVGEFQIQLWRILESKLKTPPPTPVCPNQEGFFHIQLKLYKINSSDSSKLLLRSKRNRPHWLCGKLCRFFLTISTL